MKKYEKLEKNRGVERFFKGKRGFPGVWGIKSRIFDDFWRKKGGFFEGFALIGGGFG